MTLLIDNSDLKKVEKLLRQKNKKNKNEGNLSKHFGNLKRKIDGLEYQLKVRQNED